MGRTFRRFDFVRSAENKTRPLPLIGKRFALALA